MNCMQGENYRVILLGIESGGDPCRVKERVMRIFYASPEKVEKLFSKCPVTIKSGADFGTAKRYHDALGGALNLKPAVGCIRRERLCRISLLLLAKCSGHIRYCPNPKGEFIGCSEMSLEQQKDGNRRERRMPPTAESRLIGWSGYG